MWFNTEVSAILCFLVSMAIVYLSVPSIVNVSNVLGIFDTPDYRKSHTHCTPNLGGVAIFASVVLALTLFSGKEYSNNLIFMFASMSILFFIGVKDDILMIAPSKKLLGELVSILILVGLADFRFTSLHGFLGINEIPYWVSILLTTFVMVVIINSFNLIDGIDGLASGLGVVIAVTFGIWFYLTGNYFYTLLCASISGSYLSFFGFNVFGKKNKIFMGDTGSLLLGLLVSLIVIKFNEDNIKYSGLYAVHSTPAVSFGILIIPLFDTLRVFVIRIIHGQSPFKADRNHLHHRLLLLGFSHLESTMIFVVINIVFIGIMILFNWLGIISLMLVNIGLSGGFVAFAEIRLRRGKKEEVPYTPSVTQLKNAAVKSA